MNFIFLLNGTLDKIYDSHFFQKYNCIVCVDGGYEHFLKLNIEREPNYIIGDFDSISHLEDNLNNVDKNKIIFKDNQDETDSDFALKFIMNKYSNQEIKIMDFIYTVSISRIDHLFCNTLLLKKIPPNIKSKIITKTQEFFLLRKKVDITGLVGKTLSVIPITNIKGLSIRGCRWDLENNDLDFGFIGGISNIVDKENAEITLKEGECIIVITFDLQ